MSTVMREPSHPSPDHRPGRTGLRPDPSNPPPEAVGPLIRGLAVLRELAGQEGRRPVSELARATRLARATVDRVLSTLDRIGYVRIEGRDAVLTPRLMELGNAYLAACRLPDLLGPLANRLADELDESVSLAVPDRDGVRFVHQAPRRRAMSLAFRVGDLLPAERGAPGALFAGAWSEAEWRQWRERRAQDPDDAGFPAVPRGSGDAAHSFEERVAAAREHGWSLDDQLIEPGLVAVAAPVRDAEGRWACALSVVSHTSRHDPGSLRDAVLPRIEETVRLMEQALAAPVAAAPASPPVPVPVGSSWARPAKQEPDTTPSPPAHATPSPPAQPAFVESLARGLAVLGAFGHDRPELPLTAVAEATGLARATARRALITLDHLGYVTTRGKLFAPTPRVLDLGFARLAALTLPQIAQPHLASLVERVHESASMTVLVGDDIQYVARVPTVRIMSVNITLGTRFPAHATSMGRVLLAGLPRQERTARLGSAPLPALTRHTITSPKRLSAVLDEVALDGYALVNEELEEGLRSLAVRVRDRNGHVVAAINVSMHAARSTPEESERVLLPALREAAAAIERDLHVAGRYTRISYT